MSGRIFTLPSEALRGFSAERSAYLHVPPQSSAPPRAAGAQMRRCLPTWLAINVFATLLIGHGYVSGGPIAGWGAALYAHLVLAAAFLTAALAIGLILALGTRLPAGARVVGVVGPLVAAAALAFLWIDRAAFEMYRFHVGGLAVSVLGDPQGLAALGVWPASTSGLLGGFALIAVLDGLLLRGLGSCARRAAARGERPRATWSRLVAATLVAVVTERLVFVAAERCGQRDVIRAADVAPFYPALIVVDVAKRFPSSRRAPVVASAPPRVDFAENAPRWNVLWLVLDSWRADAMTPSLTPTVWALGRRATVFGAHTSGGDATRYGLASMLYGVPASAWARIQIERRSPPLLATVRARGYRLGVFTSIDNMPDVMSVVFADVPAASRVMAPPARLGEKDRLTIGALERFLAERAPEPFFAFVHLLSTHWSYDPSCRLPITERGARPRYERAVRCADRLVARAIRRVSLRDTVVIVTADHGEAFGEGGIVGHATAFTLPELRVPLVLHVPGRPPSQVVHVTSHHDLPATVLDALGARLPSPADGIGRSLLGGEPAQEVFACSVNECAIHDADGSVRFGIGTRYPRLLTLRDVHGHRIPDDGALIRRRFAQIVDFLALQRAAFP